MLQNIRDNSTGWISKSIIGLIVVLFAFTGFDAILGSTSNSNNAAKVNGEEITLDALAEAKNLQRRQLLQQFGKDFDASLIDDALLSEAALKGLISRKLLVQAADQSGFAFSSALIDQFILLAPEFQVDGKFNADRFDQVIRQMGYTRLQFRQMIEQEMRTGQLRAGIAATTFVTEQEAQAFADLERQTRDFAMLTIKPGLDKVTVTDEEAKAYYSDNASEFLTPEQIVVEYIELDKKAFFDQVAVDDAALQEMYQAEIANLAEQRHAAHILFEVSGEVTDAQAKAAAQSAIERINAGEDFAVVAKEMSDDIGSAEQGGDLGFAAKGVYEPAFEDALYALEKEQVSVPVRTDYGWHVIKLLDVQAADIPTFASLKEKLSQDLKTQEVEQRFVEAVRDLESAAYESADLQQPASELGLEIKVSEPFGREGLDGLFANRQVLQAAFSTEVLEEGANSTAIELDPETTVVLRVKEHKRPEPIDFAEVSTQIREQLIAKRAIEQARSQGEALLSSLQEGKASVEQAQQETWQVVEAATRGQENIDPEVLQALFKMPKPEAGAAKFAGLNLGNGDYVVVRLTGVNAADVSLNGSELKQYRDILASRAGQVDFNAFLQQLELDAKIQRF
ncbi:SurA N-terminal domain-containing protein [Denitrificimonas caeni]|uniref:SurA N-terminal domain-containing protein n=1 Tax=Denitrificimonas caeni TaxID=521720 RepID=UPI0003B4C897|nr:SurA N-terminal domain-containing protein [Denitrificimonas caeni]